MTIYKRMEFEWLKYIGPVYNLITPLNLCSMITYPFAASSVVGTLCAKRSHYGVGELALLLSILLHLYLCPFTKVEESFNMQAYFDVMFHGTNISEYDHNIFPGVVPRTFMSAIQVSIFSFPLGNLLLFFDYVQVFWYQYLCRAVLGVITWYFSIRLKGCISRRIGTNIALYFALLLSLQFHFSFYASRSLPNVPALGMAMEAYNMWMSGAPVSALAWLGVAMVIFRCDMLVLLVPMALQMLVMKEISFWRALRIGIVVFVVAVGVSVVLDSVMWGRLLWPEGVVLFFNTVQNKSSEWGVFPWHWYFTSAIPRALNVCFPLMILGVSGFTRQSFLSWCGIRVDMPCHSLTDTDTATDTKECAPCSGNNLMRSAGLEYSAHKVGRLMPHNSVTLMTIYYTTPALLFVALYSFLPHKELRFIFPAIPMFTLCAAVGVHNVIPVSLGGSPCVAPAQKRTLPWLEILVNSAVWVGLVAVVVGMVAAAALFSVAAQHNYPGGEALSVLNSYIVRASTRLPQRPGDCLFVPPLGGLGNSTLLDSGADTCTPLEPYVVPGCRYYVHIDAAAAMTGITRFLQEPSEEICRVVNLHHPEQCALRASVQYSKDESEGLDTSGFDFLLRGAPVQDADFNLLGEFLSYKAIALRPSSDDDAYPRSDGLIARPLIGHLHLLLSKSIYVYSHKRLAGVTQPAVVHQ